MKKYLLVILSVLLLCTSCVKWEAEADRSNFVLSEDGSAVKLSWSCSGADIFKWYQCDDINGKNPVLVSEGKDFETKSFSKPDVCYYKCLCFKGEEQVGESFVFCVGYTGLPTVHIDTASGKEIESKRVYVDAYIKIDDQDDPLERTNCRIKGRGSSSWLLMPKKGYTIKFDDKLEVLGLKKAKKWVVGGNYIDETKIGNWYASQLGHGVFQAKVAGKKQWEPNILSVNMVVNGEYRGLYTFAEPVQLNGKRVDISDIAELDESNPDEFDVNKDGKVSLEDGGFIVEFTSDTDQTSFATLHGLTVTFKDPDFDEVTGSFSADEIKQFVRKKVNLLESSIYGETKEPFTEYMDLDSMVCWYLLNEFTGNNEAGFKTSSFIYYNPEIGKFVMGPNWDFDRTLNHRGTDSVNVTGTLALWYNQLIKNDTFTDAVKKTWNDKKSSLKKTFKDAVKYAGSLEAAKEMDSVRWGTETVEAEDIGKWLDARLEFMDRYINEL